MSDSIPIPATTSTGRRRMLDALNEAYDPRLCIARDDLLKRVDEFLSGDPKTSPRILCVRGEGGSGKTWLTHLLREHFGRSAHADTVWSSIEFGEYNNELDDLVVLHANFRTRHTGFAQVGDWLRNQHVTPPAFTRFAFAIGSYWKRFSPHAALTIPRRAQLLERSESAAAGLEISANLLNAAFDTYGSSVKVALKVAAPISHMLLLRSAPELENLDRLPEREHRLRIAKLFVDDLKQWSAQNQGRRLVLILDNFDVVARRDSPSSQRRDHWIADLVRETSGIALIVLARGLPDWIVDDRTAARTSSGTQRAAVVVDMGELEAIDAKRLALSIGIEAPGLLDAIVADSRLPMVITEKCRWTLEELEKNGGVSPKDIPRTLDEVYERLLLYRTPDERQLMKALALARHFDRTLIDAMVRLLRLQISDPGIRAILRSASVVAEFDGKYRFHDLLSEHLVARLRSPGESPDFEVTTYDALFTHAATERIHEPPAVRARFMMSAYALTQPDENGVSRLLQPTKLPEAIDATITLLRELIAVELRSEIVALGPVALRSALRWVDAAAETNPKCVHGVLDLFHLLCPELYGRGGAGCSDLALHLIREARTVFAPFLVHGGVDLPSSIWRAQAAALDVHEIRARHALAPGYDGPERPLRSLPQFLVSLELALSELARAIADAPSELPQTLKLRLFAAQTQSQLGHRLGRRGDMSKSSTYFDAASLEFKACRRVANDLALRQAYVWHLLHPPADRRLTAEDLRVAMDELTYLRSQRPLDLDLIELWMRGMIRLAYKGKDGEIEMGKPWYVPFDIVDSALVERSGKTADAGGAHLLRLALRMARKRHELDAPASVVSEAMRTLVREGTSRLAQATPLHFWTILHEVRDLLSRQHESAAEIAEAVYLLCGSQLTPWQRGVALKALYDGITHSHATNPPELSFSLADLRVQMLHPETLLVGWKSLAFIGRLHYENILSAREKIMGGASYLDVAKVFDVAGRFFSGIGREYALGIGVFQLALAKSLYESGAHDRSRVVLDAAEPALRVNGPHDLRHYAEALRFRLDRFGATLDRRKTAQLRLRVDQIRSLQREHIGVGSLQYSSTSLRASNQLNQVHLGERLLLEALAVAENELPQESALRKMVRKSIGKAVWQRAIDVNARAARNAGREIDVPLQVSADRLVSFVEGDKSNLLDDLKTLLAGVPSAHCTGSMVLAHYVDVEVSANECFAVFEHGGNAIRVTFDLLSRPLYARLRRAVGPHEEERELSGHADDHPVEDQPPRFDELHLLNIIKPKNGSVRGTMVGNVFVRSCLQLFLPGLRYAERRESGKHSIVTGGSMSWALVHIDAGTMTGALAGGGRLVNVLKQLMNLRRLTFVPLSHKDDPQSRLTEMRHFVNNTNRSAQILDIDMGRLAVQFPPHELNDARKLRTWVSMFAKAYPDVLLEVVGESIDVDNAVGQPAIPDLPKFDLGKY